MQNHLKAIELLQDWSKWLVGINSAAIGAVGALTTRPSYDLQAMSSATLLCGACATALFLVSLAFSNWLLLALPGVVQRASEHSGADVYAEGTYGGVGHRVVFFARGQHVFFLAGMLAAVAFVIAPHHPLCALFVLAVSAVSLAKPVAELIRNPERYRVPPL